MGAKRKSIRNNFYQMEKEIKDLRGKKIVVGYLGGGEQAWLASIHEYGVKILVTPKMRAWLNQNGLHLKKETKYIVIPERAFLRNGFDSNVGDVINETNPLLADVLGGNMSVEEFCNIVGKLMVGKIQEYAIDLKTPANHPFTIEKKGSSNPLVSSGDMIEALTYEIEG